MMGRLQMLALAGVMAAGCQANQAEEPSAEPAVRIDTNSVTRVTIEQIRTGPLISGQLSAARKASVRAEVGGAVVRTAFEIGQRVQAGAVLARIEARDLNDAATSEKVAVQSATAALGLAESEAHRTERLVKAGALAERDLEIAQNAVATARSQLAAARGRLASAQAQLADTVVRAPISGIVSEKAANTGDIVAPGTPLYTIVDPSSMRLEASVPSDQIAELRPGLPVEFTVRGHPGRTFSGHVERISPTVDPATRQVPIFVSVPNIDGNLIAGLYANGRVQTDIHSGLIVPGAAIEMTGQSPAVIRIRNGKAERVPVTLGVRDEDTERVEVVSGVSEGDVLLLGAARAITPGTPVTIGG
jgi:RND family efflux transporter MFP subunit